MFGHTKRGNSDTQGDWTGCLQMQRAFTLDRNSTYAVLSRNEQCRELRAHEGGGSQKVTSDDEGGQDTP